MNVTIATRQFVALLLISYAAWFTYENNLQGILVWDSIHYLNGNPYIKELNLTNLWWMLTSQHLSNWHPVTWLSYALDYKIHGGLSASGFRLSNIILHAFNAWLLFNVILIVFREKNSSAPDNTAYICGLIAAFFFTVHPIHTESVAWVAERKDLLFYLFLCLSFLAYARYLDIKKPAGAFYILSIIMYALALMSKPMAVTFPVVLIIADVFIFRRVHSIHTYRDLLNSETYFLLREKIPFFVLSLATVIITLAAQKQAITGAESISLDLRILNAANSLIVYIQQFFFPVNLSPYYPYIDIPEGPTTLYFSLAGTIFITALAIYAYTKGITAYIGAWLFYLVTLSPVIGIIQVGGQAHADRYTYFPFIALYILTAFMLYKFVHKKSSRLFAFSIASIALIIVLSSMTMKQVKAWKNPVTLWKHVVLLYPGSGLAQANLASSLYQAGDYHQAAKHFKLALDKKYLNISHITTASLAFIRVNNLVMAKTLYLQAMKNHGDSGYFKGMGKCINRNMLVIELNQIADKAGVINLQRLEIKNDYRQILIDILNNELMKKPHETQLTRSEVSSIDYCHKLRQVNFN